jgi:hypothetical protein
MKTKSEKGELSNISIRAVNKPTQKDMHVKIGSVLDEIREKVDLFDFVSQYTTLELVRDKYIGTCPLHINSKKLFFLNKNRLFFHCLECKAGGDIFSFVMKKERMTLPESVLHLAKKLDIKGRPEFYRKEFGEIISFMYSSSLRINRRLYLIHESLEDTFAAWLNGEVSDGKLALCMNEELDRLFDLFEMHLSKSTDFFGEHYIQINDLF